VQQIVELLDMVIVKVLSHQAPHDDLVDKEGDFFEERCGLSAAGPTIDCLGGFFVRDLGISLESSFARDPSTQGPDHAA
jgi:hypothetical protein